MRTRLARHIQRALRVCPGNARHGAALVTVLAFSLVTLIVGASLLSAGSSESRNAQQRLNSQKAFWLAEAGYQKLTAETYDDVTWLTSNRSFSDTLSGGSYTLSVRDTSLSGLAAGVTPYHVIATGIVQGYNATTTRSIDMLMTVAAAPASLALGSASPANYAMLAVGGADIKMSGSSAVQGTVAHLGVLDGDLTLAGSAKITGTAYVSSGEVVSSTGSGSIGSVVQNATTDAMLGQAALDALAASSSYAALPATNATKTITGSKTLTGVAGLNVVNLTSFDVTGNKTITINAPATAIVVVNCSGVFALDGGSQIVLAGGISANNVLWNITGSGNLTITSSSVVNGVVLAPYRTTTLGGSSTINGALLCGGDPMSIGGGGAPVIDINGNSVINGCGGSGTTGSGNLALLHWADGH